MGHIMKCIKPQGYILEKKIVVFNFKVFFLGHPHFGRGGGRTTPVAHGGGSATPKGQSGPKPSFFFSFFFFFFFFSLWPTPGLMATPKPNGGGFGHPQKWPCGWLGHPIIFILFYFILRNH
jgi:hypothetical protein